MMNTRRNLAYALTIAAAVIFVLLAFAKEQEAARAEGRAHGYTTGYSIGYTDHLNGTEQDPQKLAGKIVPYEAGTGKWKYFIMGFGEGYDDGLSGEKIWDINES